jgi:hypothetical protein
MAQQTSMWSHCTASVCGESMSAALACYEVSYLDNRDLYMHGSVPDPQSVCVTTIWMIQRGGNINSAICDVIPCTLCIITDL